MNHKQKVVIFGADGQLGSDLTKVLETGFAVVALNRVQADIANAEAVREIISLQQPEFVINAAAYNKVDAAEAEASQAFAANAIGVHNLAKACSLVSGQFIHFSTDYVFDGAKKQYAENDLPQPINVYGASKLAGEELARIATPKHYIIRTSAVFGAAQGKQKMNFVDKIIVMAGERKQLRIVADQFTCPTYSWDLAEKVKQFMEKSPAYGVYHMTGEGSCSWYEFAKKTLELKSLSADIVPVSTEEFTAAARRPKYGILKNEMIQKLDLKPLPHWTDSLQRYLKAKQTLEK